MLAYVFWHFPRPDADRHRYERNMVSLHEKLHQSSAVIDSITYKIEGVPWANAGGSAYEDWYLVNDWAQFGALNVRAVDAGARPPHDGVAQSYGGGAGGVYELRAGAADLRRAVAVQWIVKPRGVSYATFDEELADSIGSGALWRRQMVLGPGTEFCLQRDQAATLDEQFAEQAFTRAVLT
jgi:hypothetical protein